MIYRPKGRWLPLSVQRAGRRRCWHWACPFYAFLAIPAAARLLRRFARRFIHQDAVALQLDPTEWHTYQMEWRSGSVHFRVDEQPVFQTELAPIGPLGLVIWIDNQYAAFPPDGRLRYGTLPAQEETWIEVIGA